MTKSGAGFLTLSGVNGYSGTTLISQGKLTYGVSDAIAAGDVTVSSGAILDMGIYTDTVGAVSISGTLAGTGTLTGSSYSLTGATIDANLGTGTITNAGGATALNGTLTGSGSLFISGGTVSLGVADRINDLRTVSLAGGSLNLGANSETIANLNISNGNLNGTGTLTVTGSIDSNVGSGTLNALVDGLVVINGGTVSLGASDRLTATSDVSIAAGSFNLGAFTDSIDKFAISGTGTLAGTGTLTATDFYHLNGGTVNANLGEGYAEAQGPGSTILNGTLAADLNALTGSVTLGNNNRIADTADVTLTSGTLNMAGFNDTVASFTAIQGSSLTGTGTLTSADGVYGLSTGPSALATININANVGVGTLNVAGAGRVNLGGTSAASTVNVNGGTLALGVTGGRLTGAPAVTVASGATLSLGGAESVGTLAGAATGTVQLDANTLTVGAANGSSAFAGKFTSTGAGGLTKAGSGTVTLSGDSSGYAGTTTINAGTLKVTAAANLGTSNVKMSAGNLYGGDGATVSRAIVIGTAEVASAPSSTLLGWDFSANTVFGPSPMAATIVQGVTTSGLVRGSGVTTAGSGATNGWGGDGFNLSTTTAAAAITANDFVTFTVTSGVGTSDLSQIPAYNIRRSSTGPTNGQWQYQINNGAFTDIGGQIAWGGVTNAAGNSQTAIDLSAISALQDVASGTVVTFRIVSYGATSTGGTWYFNGFGSTALDIDLALKGQYTIPAAGTGQLGIDEAGTATFSGAVTVNNTATLYAATDGTAIFSGLVDGPGAITKSGPGVVKLSNATGNTYAGTTTVSGGRLLANNTSGSATGAGAVQVNSTGSLGGSGIVTGSVTVASGGTIAPGDGVDAVGKLAVATGGSKTLTLEAGSTYEFDFNGVAVADGDTDGVTDGAGTSYDTLDVGSGTLSVTATGGSLANQVTIVMKDLGASFNPFVNYLWKLASAAVVPADAGLANKFFINVAGLADAAQEQFTVTSDVGGAGGLYVRYIAVPEPGSLFSFAIPVATLMLRRRRARRRAAGVTGQAAYLTN